MFGTNGRRIVAGAGIALALTMSATACGGSDGSKGVDTAAFTKKLKSEKRFKDAPAKYVDCVRKIALKYGEDDRIQKYMKKARTELTSCVK